MSAVWTLDYLDSASPIVRALFNDWTVSGIVTLQSGSALTITAGQDRNLDGINNDRADLIGDPTLDSGRSRDEAIAAWFNTAAFALPAAGTDGGAGRGIIDGPGYRNFDLGRFKDFGLPGRAVFQFRIENDQRVQHGQPVEPRDELQRAGHVRPDSHRR